MKPKTNRLILFVLKSGTDYIRVRDDGFESVPLEKATVFPFGQLETVRTLLAKLRSQDHDSAAIARLILTEEAADDAGEPLP